MQLTPRNARVVAYFRRYWTSFAIGAVFLIATNFLGLQIPRHIGAAIAAMQDGGMTGDAVLEATKQHALYIILFALGAGIARVGSRIQIFNAGRLIEFDVRNELYDHITRLSPAWFGSIPTGDLTSRVSNDVNFIRLLYAISFLHVVNTFVAYIIALNKMIPLDWRLTLVCLGPFPVILMLSRIIVKALFNQTKVVQTQLSTLSSRVQENLSGVAVVRAYVMQEREQAKFSELNDAFVGANIKLITLRGALQATMTLLAGIGTLGVLFVGANRVVEGTLTLGQFVEFNGYVVALAFPTIGLGWVFSVWNRGIAAFDRVFEVLNAPVDIADDEDAQPLPDLDGPRGHIVLRDVDFSYTPGTPTLRNINMDMSYNSCINACIEHTEHKTATLTQPIQPSPPPTKTTTTAASTTTKVPPRPRPTTHDPRSTTHKPSTIDH